MFLEIRKDLILNTNEIIEIKRWINRSNNVIAIVRIKNQDYSKQDKKNTTKYIDIILSDWEYNQVKENLRKRNLI